MRQKKKEIYIALNIIFDMFVLFTIFNFISTVIRQITRFLFLSFQSN